MYLHLILQGGNDVGLVFPGVKRVFVFVFFDFAFKLVTHLCSPTALLPKVEIAFTEEVLRSKLNKITGYCRFIERHGIPPASCI